MGTLEEKEKIIKFIFQDILQEYLVQQKQNDINKEFIIMIFNDYIPTITSLLLSELLDKEMILFLCNSMNNDITTNKKRKNQQQQQRKDLTTTNIWKDMNFSIEQKYIIIKLITKYQPKYIIKNIHNNDIILTEQKI